ncbi:MAG: helix-turn-helix transcriptional regulator [Eubacteriales bacterium]|nr:helix-turn-helix transcriptional regulator [Eubacteriales bacterium]
MRFEDKLMQLRKRAGWSQEELAEKLDVSRQAVSKWESAQSTPDLERVLALARLFGVSTDYLLKEEAEEEELCGGEAKPASGRLVTMGEAEAFLEVKARTADRIAWAVFACVISPIALLLLGAAAEQKAVPEMHAAVIGLVVLLVIVAGAVTVFIGCGTQTAPYQYMEKEAIETAPGVADMVRERQKAYRESHGRANRMGACLCILSVVPLLMAAFFTENALQLTAALSLMMAIAGLGTVSFIRAGIRWESMQKLLEEGDYSRNAKKRNTQAISTAYWLLAVAIYLGYSFATEDWKNSWIVWPVAGVLYAALATVLNGVFKR